MKHYKTDMLTDEEMAHFETKAGDVLNLNVPAGEGKFIYGEHAVIEVQIEDGGTNEGVHYTKVTLTLEG